MAGKILQLTLNTTLGKAAADAGSGTEICTPPTYEGEMIIRVDLPECYKVNRTYIQCNHSSRLGLNINVGAQITYDQEDRIVFTNTDIQKSLSKLPSKYDTPLHKWDSEDLGLFTYEGKDVFLNLNSSSRLPDLYGSDACNQQDRLATKVSAANFTYKVDAVLLTMKIPEKKTWDDALGGLGIKPPYTLDFIIGLEYDENSLGCK